MPYSKNSDLPAAIKNALPPAAQTIYRKAHAQALKSFTGDETKASKVGWTAVKQAGYKKVNGTWVSPVGKRVKNSAATGEKEERVARGVIAKVDEDERRAFGWAQVSIAKDSKEPLFDAHDDSIHIDELEKGAYGYVRNSRVAGVMHARVSKGANDEPVRAGTMIESMVFTPEKIEKLGLPEGFPQGWWIGFDVDDEEVWKGVKNGTLPMFSVHGKGFRQKLKEGDAA